MPQHLGIPDAPKSPAFEHGRVLYVESDATLRESFVRCLGRHGVDVDTASSRDEAVQLLTKQAYPVIVADLADESTAQPNGVSVVDELHDLQPHASFVLTTADDAKRAASGTLQESVACYLRKPWTPGQLTHAVDSARENYRTRHASHMAPDTNNIYAVLLIEDDDAAATRLSVLLDGSGVCSEHKHCQTILHATSLLRARQFDAVLLDISVAGVDGNARSSSFEQLKAAAPEAALIVIGHDEPDSDQGPAVRRGAQDFLLKDQLDVTVLRRTLQESIERKHHERKLAYAAEHDPVTQLVNSAGFETKIEAAVANTRRSETCCAVLRLSLDGFRLVHEQHGEEAGDTVLCEVGRRIQASVREEDSVARLDGDQFGVLLTQVEDAPVCLRVAQRILDIVNVPVLLHDELVVSVRASVGIAVCPQSGLEGHGLLERADAALQTARAKNAGILLHTPAAQAKRTG